MADNDDAPEYPRVEPEILPPHRDRSRSTGRPPWGAPPFGETGGMHRVYVTRLGPFGGALLMLAIVVIAAVILLAFVGALLLWIPFVALIVIVAAVLGLLRRRLW